MSALVDGEALQRFPYALVGYWNLTPVGVKIATLETATFALVAVPGMEINSGIKFAQFQLPAERAELETLLAALKHVFNLGAAYKAAEVRAALGVEVLNDPLRFSAPRSLNDAR